MIPDPSGGGAHPRPVESRVERGEVGVQELRVVLADELGQGLPDRDRADDRPTGDEAPERDDADEPVVAGAAGELGARQADDLEIGRDGVASMSEALTTSRPPGARSGSYFAIDGGLSATTLSATSTIGEPIGWSAMTTVHDAVPPRISGPYDGIHETSRPSSRAAWARTWPANRRPWPPKPPRIVPCSTVSPRRRRRRGAAAARAGRRSRRAGRSRPRRRRGASIDSVGVIPQPTGQVERTSTIDSPPPASWISNARRIIAFVLPMRLGSAIDPRAA